jgi:hypothetical protein
MPISTSDLKWYYTGGDSNSDPALSLGGVISSVQVTTGLNNIFDDVRGVISFAGGTDYRCVAFKNTHATLSLEVSSLWISANTPGGDDIQIALETPTAGNVQQIATMTTAPTNLTFASADGEDKSLVATGEGSASGIIAPGQWVAVWIKRTVPSATMLYENYNFEIGVKGETKI